MKRKLVLVGNGMAGVRTLEELLKLDPDLYDITVFGSEPYGNYNRIMLSPMLAGEKTLSDIMLNDPSWYQENNIVLHTNSKVLEIDRFNRRVMAENGNSARYDRLILATGSSPFMLPVAGTALPGVLTYRDVADVNAMLAASKSYKKAVVIGGGLLGLEAANGLMQQGMQVSVVHITDSLMDRQLDHPAADLLKTSLQARGLEFLMNTKTVEIVGDQRVRAVKFADGAQVSADLVVMAVGIVPNIELAQKANIHCQRGIVVSDTMQTFDPNIYAVGECVEHRAVCYGLVAPLFDQAKVCANHLAQIGTKRYPGSLTSTKLKVTGIDLFSAGEFNETPDDETLVLQDPAQGVYKKVVIENNRIKGAVLYGDTIDGSWYFQLMREGTDISGFRSTLLFGQHDLGDAGHGEEKRVVTMSDDAEICGCNGVCKGEIVAAIGEKGLFTLDDCARAYQGFFFMRFLYSAR